MGDDYIDHTWQRSTLAYGWPDAPEEKISFYHRDPIDIARWLLSQPAYQAYMRYAPVFKEHRLYDDVTDEDTGKTRRVYEDMETCDYWHEKQVNSVRTIG